MKTIRGMTMVACGALLAALAGCLDLTTTEGGQTGGTTSSGGFTSSNGGMGCDSSATCDECIQCESAAPGGNCIFEAGACSTVQDCMALDGCIRSCATNDTACLNLCTMTHPIGFDVYMDYYLCMYCQHCSKSCATTLACQG